ncbi:MAG: hypothetical protein ABI622_09905 [Chloroflexota bacterium]
MNLLIAAFLAAHALIHASYLSPAPAQTAGGPEWPFTMGRSWLVTGLHLEPRLVTSIGTLLIVTTVAVLLLAALATVGIGMPSAWWPYLVTAGAGLSIASLAIFFHPWLILGLAIDAVLLWSVLVADWMPAASS